MAAAIRGSSRSSRGRAIQTPSALVFSRMRPMRPASSRKGRNTIRAAAACRPSSARCCTVDPGGGLFLENLLSLPRLPRVPYLWRADGPATPQVRACQAVVRVDGPRPPCGYSKRGRLGRAGEVKTKTVRRQRLQRRRLPSPRRPRLQAGGLLFTSSSRLLGSHRLGPRAAGLGVMPDHSVLHTPVRLRTFDRLKPSLLRVDAICISTCWREEMHFCGCLPRLPRFGAPGARTCTVIPILMSHFVYPPSIHVM